MFNEMLALGAGGGGGSIPQVGEGDTLGSGVEITVDLGFQPSYFAIAFDTDDVSTGDMTTIYANSQFVETWNGVARFDTSIISYTITSTGFKFTPTTSQIYSTHFYYIAFE